MIFSGGDSCKIALTWFTAGIFQGEQRVPWRDKGREYVYVTYGNFSSFLTEPAIELSSRAAPSVEANHKVNGHITERNSGGRWIKKPTNNKKTFLYAEVV